MSDEEKTATRPGRPIGFNPKGPILGEPRGLQPKPRFAFVVSDQIDDAVGTFDYLTNFVELKFWHHPARKRKARYLDRTFG
jgi:hypothetical protein